MVVSSNGLRPRPEVADTRVVRLTNPGLCRKVAEVGVVVLPNMPPLWCKAT